MSADPSVARFAASAASSANDEPAKGDNVPYAAPHMHFNLQVLAVVLAAWLNRHQRRVLEYLLEENRVLKAQLRGRRLRLTDDDRRRLAVFGIALGRRVLGQFATIVTPETILRWHRYLIAQKWTFPSRRTSRKKLMQKIAELAVRMARENVTWGYDRIVGALAHLGHHVAPTTIRNILKKHREPLRSPAARRFPTTTS